MKAILATKRLSLAIVFLAVTFFSGCKTAPPLDWNSRIGIYTYDQCVAELGWPDKQTKTSDGKIVDQWITLHGSNGFTGGAGFTGGNYGMGAGQPIAQSFQDHVLELTFGTDGKLVSVAKNY